jgi:CelD/BcsL family acetyltransferase involved in cellulose biosynthesis
MPMETTSTEYTEGSSYRIAAVCDIAEFRAMRSEWTDLLHRSRSDTIFLTWEWLYAWWMAYGSSDGLLILTVRRRNELVGLAPLYCKDTTKWGLCYRAVHFVGDGSSDSDYLDFIIAAGHEKPVLSAIAQHLFSSRVHWDILFLNEMPRSSPSLPIIKEWFERAGCFLLETDVPCAYVELPGTWEEYVGALKPRMRSKIRSLARELGKAHEVRFSACETIEEIEPRLKRLFALHRARWQTKGQQGVFERHGKQAFYGEMSRLFLQNGWLRFYELDVDQAPAALQFCFEYQGTMSLLQEAFDPSLEPLAPGNVLRRYVFEDCIDRKVKVYDFLGGVTFHKLSWGAAIKTNVRLAIGRPFPRNVLYFKLPWLKDQVKQRLPWLTKPQGEPS